MPLFLYSSFSNATEMPIRGDDLGIGVLVVQNMACSVQFRTVILTVLNRQHVQKLAVSAGI